MDHNGVSICRYFSDLEYNWRWSSRSKSQKKVLHEILRFENNLEQFIAKYELQKTNDTEVKWIFSRNQKYYINSLCPQCRTYLVRKVEFELNISFDIGQNKFYI